MFINITVQILWITFGSITLPASLFYHANDLQIGILAMVFIIVFIPLSLPVSWTIDTFGFYKPISAAAVLMGLFAILRGLMGQDYSAVLICTIGIAITQPFLLNSWTKVAAQWFPIHERGTAVGLTAVGSFIGTGIGLAVTPLLIEMMSIPNMLFGYGIIAAVSALFFVIFARERPATPPCPPEYEARVLMLDGLKILVKSPPFWILMWIFLICNGIFNGISTWIESIVRPRGFTPVDAGLFGGVLLLGGILGAIVLPSMSDKYQKRLPFIFIGLCGAVVGLIGLAFGLQGWVLTASSFVLGFFLISCAPIGYQYAAELTYPVPEGTSNGLLTLAGQCSVIFIYGMEAFKNGDGSFTLSLLLLVGFSLSCLFLMIRLYESPLILENRG
jgi:MFS family permease